MKKKRRILPSFLIPALFLVIVGQLIWWMVFFRMQDQRMASMQSELDALQLERLERLTPEQPDLDETELAIKTDTGWKIKEEVLEARQSESQRKSWMLLSESLFAFVVLAAGSYFIINAIRKERDLLKEKELFLHSVSHELKTPIAGIQLNLQTLQKRSLAEKQGREILDDTISQIRNLNSTVAQLLPGELISDAGGKRTASLKEAVEQALDQHRVLAENRRARIHDATTDMHLAIPETLLGRALGHIIENSLMYGPEGVQIWIRTVEHPEHCHLVIEDNGPGVPGSDLSHIFEPLVRLDNHKGYIKGTGMGLYIVQEILHQWSAGIQAEIREGGGLRMNLELPRAAG
ncbi:MAG: HAMP domain-containing histidine kinase [Leptospiraceae bacterium]|nr:HAMP domain-containing histidine kinase [Leptospiraceae bacterium]